MQTQLTDYGFHFNKIPIYCDSKSSIAISCNPVQHSRTKHIAVCNHFIKVHVEKGTIELYFVKMDYQLADIFTKTLTADRFNYLVRRLGMRSLSPKELERLAKSQSAWQYIKDRPTVVSQGVIRQLRLGIVQTEMVLELEQSQQGSSHKVSVSTEGVEELKRIFADIQNLETVTGCQALNFPFTYLGLPINCNMSRCKGWDSIIEKFTRRLSKWKANLLSIGGRSTLITSVLETLVGLPLIKTEDLEEKRQPQIHVLQVEPNCMKSMTRSRKSHETESNAFAKSILQIIRLSGRIVGNKMLKSFPLLLMKIPLPEYFPIASEEVFPLLRQRDAPAKEVCTAGEVKD
nr:retrovirus-related Pol polyprotein from transposon TNT 1-94 [Tanacetum cinerariifolium]